MLRALTLSLLFLFISHYSYAQLPDGSIAPDWTLTDMDGNTYNLYDILDQGKPVALEFSATWCGPCWNYHNTHIMDDINQTHGTGGTNDVAVFFIEGDPSTNDACVLNIPGCNSSTWGDWTDGISFPLFNAPTGAVRNAYSIGFWPTLYGIAPNRKIYLVGQASFSTWESWLLTTLIMRAEYDVTHVTCAGNGEGAIDLTVFDGAGNLNYEWSNGATTQDLNGIEPGVYSVTVTEGRGHSIEVENIIVEGPSQEITIETEEQSPECNGAATGYVNAEPTGGTGGFSYLWNTGDTQASIQNMLAGTYEVTVTDDVGCTESKTVTLIDPPLLQLFEVDVEPASCGISNGSIQVIGQGGTGSLLYSFDGQDYDVQTNFSPLDPGTYVTSVLDENGCEQVLSSVVEAIDNPVATAMVDSDLDCQILTTTVSGDGSSTGNYDYEWTTVDGTIDSGQGTLEIVASSPGTYTLNVYDNQYGCVSSAEVEVLFTGDYPNADAGEDQEINCTVNIVTLDGALSDQGDDYTYLWSTNNGNILSDPTLISIEADAPGLYEIEVTNNATNCISIATVEVINNVTEIMADAGDPTSLTCLNTVITLDGSNSTTNDDFIYSWTTDDGNIVSGDNTLTPTVDAPGTYTLSIEDPVNGCFNTSTVVVEDNSEIQEASITEPQNLTCLVTETTIELDVDGEDLVFEWNTQDGNITSQNDIQNITVDAPGTYTVQYSDPQTGCSGELTVEIDEIINEPVAAFSSSQELNTHFFNDLSEGEPVTYLWDFGDGNTSTESNPSHEYTMSGEYTVCLTITNDCGENTSCTDITVVLGSSLLLGVETQNVVCFDECNGSLLISTQEDPNNYDVVVTGPNGFVVEGIFALDDLCAGSYSYTVTNEIGDEVSGEVVIEQPMEIIIEESVIVSLDCAGDMNGSVSIVVSGGTGSIIPTWSNGVEGTEVNELEGGEISVSLVDDSGCEKIFTFIIEEPEPLNLDDKDIVNIDDNTSLGSIDITVSGGTGDYTFLWSNGETTEDVFDLDEGEYTVIVTDDNGCKETFGPFTVQNLVSVSEIDGLNKLILGPNPTDDQVLLKLFFQSFTTCTIELIDNTGALMESRNVQGVAIEEQILLRDRPSGLYLIKIQVGDQITYRKIIKE